MKIIVDAMGGDNAPLEILRGAEAAAKELHVDIILCGSSEKIKSCAAENNINISGMEIIDAQEDISMSDDPMCVIREKKDSSMAKGLKALKDGKGDAFVSAGSTGALVVGGTFIVKRIKGIKRAAIAAVMPSAKGPFMLIDTGANNVCKAEYLKQFAVMGSIYMNKILGIDSPRVGIANIGTEETKGTELQKETYALLKETDLNFIGNTEVRDIPFGAADVIVSDGFTGNVILKMYEGTAKFFSGSIKSILKRSPVSLFGALFVKSGFEDLKKKMDYKEFGGAPLMGLAKPVIKAHGSSDARAFKNAVRQAVSFAEMKVTETIAENIKDNEEDSED